MRRLLAAIWLAGTILCVGAATQVVRGDTIAATWNFYQDDVRLEKSGEYTQLFLKDAFQPQETLGWPSLPVKYVYILIPPGAAIADVNVVANEVLLASDILVYPVQPARTTNDPPVPFLPPGPEVYASAQKIPAALGALQGIQHLHDYSLAAIRLNPLRYIPSRRELYLATQIDVTISYSEGITKKSSQVSWKQYPRRRTEVLNLVSNPNDIDRFSPIIGNFSAQQLPEVSPMAGMADYNDAVYLLITNNALAETFQTLVDRRTAQGKTGELVTIEDINNTYDGTRPDGGTDLQTKIRNCIINYYLNHGTRWVALGGDDSIVPVRYCHEETSDDNPTDLYYGGLDGSWDENGNGVYGEITDSVDMMPEVWVGRIPVRTEQQADDYINKVIIYEDVPPDNFAGRFLLSGSGGGVSYGRERPNDFLDHDPVSVMEIFINRIFRDCVQPWWQPTVLHQFFDTRTSWDVNYCGEFEQNTNNYTSILNTGYHFVIHTNHGNSGCVGLENGLFCTADALSLTNSSRPMIFYAVFACYSGGFDFPYDPSLSEAMLRNPNGGAVVYLGTSRQGLISGGYTGGHSYDYARMFYTELFKNGRATFGEAFAYSKIDLIGSCQTEGGYRYIQYHLNFQGDPAISIKAQEPSKTLQIDSPNAREFIDQGALLPVRWCAGGSEWQNGDKVKLEYSTDAGVTWQLIPDAESLDYNMPVFYWSTAGIDMSERCLVRVTCLSDPVVSDATDNNFTIGQVGTVWIKSLPVQGITILGTVNMTCPISVCQYFPLTDFTYTVLKGKQLSLTASGLDDYDFIEWINANGKTLTHSTNYSFTFNVDTILTAEYEKAGSLRDYYVNDETAETGFAPGDDSNNDGLSPETPVRHIQQIIDRYGDIRNIYLSSGNYRENIKIDSHDPNISIIGSGTAATIIDGNQTGSCIWLSNAVNTQIQGVTIRNGMADNGGGICAANSNFTVSDCNIVDNTANAYGGGLMSWSCNTTLNNNRFINNIAGTYAGAVVCDQCSLVLNGNTIRQNRGLCGGGVGVSNADSIFVTNNEISDNNSSAEGGGIYFAGCKNIEISNNTISNNLTVDRGGGLFINDCNSIKLSNNSIAYNQAREGSGAAVWKCQKVDFLSNTVKYNTNGNGHGGGLYCYDTSSLEIRDNSIEGNFAGNIGGGIATLNCASVDLTGNTLFSNRATIVGGYWSLMDDYVSVSHNLICGNTSNNDSGGICLQGSTGIVAGNVISNNMANFYGGGILLRDGADEVLLVNNILSGNIARYNNGGGVNVYLSSQVKITNCTITANRAGGCGGGICLWGGSCTIEDSILWDNNTLCGPELAVLTYNDPSQCKVAYSNLKAGLISVNVQSGCTLDWEVGNIDVDPCFAMPGYWDLNGTPDNTDDDFWVDGDYHLKSEAGSWDPDAYKNADLTGDEFVNFEDFSVLAESWCQSGAQLPTDLDGDGIVAMNDLVGFALQFLTEGKPGGWVLDNVTSRCIDAGNPGSGLGDEPDSTDNLRINMGAYGRTPEASIPPHGWSLLADLTNDGFVNLEDYALQATDWLNSADQQPGDLNRDSLVGISDLALLVEDWLGQTTWHE